MSSIIRRSPFSSLCYPLRPLLHKPFQSFSSLTLQSSTRPLSVSVSKLNREHLERLLERKTHCLVVPQFLSADACQQASLKILGNQIQEYTNAPGIGRIGIAYFETTGNSEMEEAYFKEAATTMAKIRSYFSGSISPIDRLRLALDDAWPEGACLDAKKGRKMFAGLCRALEHGREIFPHEDVLERDDPSQLSQGPLRQQLSANVYLQVSEEGGELELYDVKHSTAQYDALRKSSYGIDRTLVPAPFLRHKPNTGDLVLFNPSYTHSVSKVIGRARLSMSCFIGFRNIHSPLKMWS